MRDRRRPLLGLAAVVLTFALPAVDPAAAQLVPPPGPLVHGPAPTDWPRPTSEQVSAASWVLIEAGTGQRLAEHAAEQPRPVASTIKILTALTATQRASLDEEVTVGDEVLVGGATVGLTPGETWTVRQLLEGVLVRSGNDAAEALATHVAGDTASFVDLMEGDAEALGLAPRQLASPSGLGDLNRLSALELATLARAALADEQLRPLLALEETSLPGEGTVENRNELLGRYPGATGVKTGFTLAAGNSLVASARRGDRELVAVVLDAGDDPARFEQAATLLDLGFAAFTTTEIEATLELAQAGGWRTFSSVPQSITSPTDRPPELDLAVPTRVPEGAVTAGVTVAGTGLADAELAPSAPTARTGRSSPAAGLGAALVDGAYASLRAASTADGLR